MPIKLIAILSVLAAFVLAAPPAQKGKAPATKGPAAKSSATKAKAPVAAAAVRKPAAKAAAPVRPPATAATARGKAPAPAAKVANSRAVYSRTPVRYNRRAPGRRVAVVRQPAVYVPQVPSADRYREIQQALADKGFFKGEVSGSWTPESTAALKDFQRAQNLEPDGKLGSLSLIALGLGPKRIVAAQNTPPPALPQPQQ